MGFSIDRCDCDVFSFCVRVCAVMTGCVIERNVVISNLVAFSSVVGENPVAGSMRGICASMQSSEIARGSVRAGSADDTERIFVCGCQLLQNL